jgi:hypothetical protein
MPPRSRREMGLVVTDVMRKNDKKSAGNPPLNFIVIVVLFYDDDVSV